MTDTLMSVAGPVDVATLGITLPHEHIYIDFNCIPDRFDYPDLLDDDDLLKGELEDVCRTVDLRTFGGRGYTYIQNEIVPRLHTLGVSGSAAAALVSDNARRWLTIRR